MNIRGIAFSPAVNNILHSVISFVLEIRPWLRIRDAYSDSKVHGANMGPTWVLSAPDGPHVPCYQGSNGLISNTAYTDGRQQHTISKFYDITVTS